MSSIDSAIDLNAGSVSENVKTMLRGELVLAFAVIINSLGVVLMLYSGTGISAISSVPYAFSEVFPKIAADAVLRGICGRADGYFPKSSLRLLLVRLHICSRDFLYSAL